MENPGDSPEGAITRGLLADSPISDVTPTKSDAQGRAARDCPPSHDTSLVSTLHCEHDREQSTAQNRPTESSDQNDTAQQHSSKSTDFLDHHRETSLVDDRATESTIQDTSNLRTAFNRDHFGEGDPLEDDEKLLWGPRLAQPGDDSNDTIQKVPSDQGPLKFRWGSTARTTGRAKTGLLIQVPGPQTSISLVKGGPITGNSIMYAYASSSSSSGRTTNSFGAVGDHLSSTKSNCWSLNLLPSVQEDLSIDQAPRTHQPDGRALASAGAIVRSRLASLVCDSTPDTPFPLVAVGEIGPLQQPIAAQVVAPSNLQTRRRRSLSDLIQSHPRPLSPINQDLSDAIAAPRTGGARPPQEAPIWYRNGPPFFSSTSRATNMDDDVSSYKYLDPETFSLPFGSKVYIMKAKNLINLRTSVRIGVWSSPPGVSRVFQNEWEWKKGNEKIIFLFSIIKGHKHNGKYCGMAEMSGPYNAEFNPKIWTDDMQGNQGSIPLRWLVAKEVPFSVFDGQKQNETPVTMMRHGNIVVGEVGRHLIQTYFEHAHGNSAIIHPDYDLVDNGQPTRNPFSQFSRGRDWHEGQGQRSRGRQPRHQGQVSLATQDYSSSSRQMLPTDRPPFRNAYQGDQPQSEKVHPYSQTQNSQIPPDRALHDPRADPSIPSQANLARSGYRSQYGHDPRADVNFAPQPWLALTVSRPHPGPASHGYQPLVKYESMHHTPPDTQATSTHGPRYDYAPRLDTYTLPLSGQTSFQAGRPGANTVRNEAFSGSARPLDTPYPKSGPLVAPMDVSGNTRQSWDSRAGHAHPSQETPAFGPTPLAPRQAAPLNGSSFRPTSYPSQTPAVGPRVEQATLSAKSDFSGIDCTAKPRLPAQPWEAVPATGSHFGPITPANARARFGSNFHPLRAPRYHPLGYTSPIRGSHFEHGQPQAGSRQVPRLRIPEIEGGDEQEHVPIREHSYDWKL